MNSLSPIKAETSAEREFVAFMNEAERADRERRAAAPRTIADPIEPFGWELEAEPYPFWKEPSE